MRFSPIGLAATGALLTTACVSVLPEQPKPLAVYELPAPQTKSRLQANVVIREPDAPRLFASRQVTSQGPDGGLKIVPDVAWADRATRMFQVNLLQAFDENAPGLAVDDVTGVSGAYELYWRVSRFTLDSGEGVCTLQLTLLDGRSREPVSQDTVTARSPTTARGELPRARALADAGRQCVEQAAGLIADKAVLPADDGSELNG
jgi:cholesterol transport system auxiliary component